MKVFVSYASANRPLVNDLVKDLIDMNYDVWYDQALTGGQKWWDNILEHLRWCDTVVFALTQESLDSYPCQLEYTYANALGKHIVPVVLTEGIRYRELPSVLQLRQVVDYQQRSIDSFKRLVTALRDLPETPPLPDPLPDPPKEPISPLADIRAQLTSPNLTYEQQVSILHQLKGFMDNPQYMADARSLMLRLNEHPRLFAAVMRDVEAILRTQQEAARQKKDPTLPDPTPAEPDAPTVRLHGVKQQLSPAPEAAAKPDEKPEEKHDDKPDDKPPESSAAFKPEIPTSGERYDKEYYQQPPLTLQPDETILRDLSAMILGEINKGGKMTITSQRVVFQYEHGLQQVEIPYTRLSSVQKSTLLMVFPAVDFVLNDGSRFKFYIYEKSTTGSVYGNREALIAVIIDALRKSR